DLPPVKNPNENEKRECGWEYAERAPNIEISQAHGCGAVVFQQQKSRDQVAGENEKDANAKRSGILRDYGRYVSPARHVAEHDHSDRDRAQAVERRDPSSTHEGTGTAAILLDERRLKAAMGVHNFVLRSEGPSRYSFSHGDACPRGRFEKFCCRLLEQRALRHAIS